ncbi:MAG: tetratricopeptide repeat protein [Pseudomonadota bacterium]
MGRFKLASALTVVATVFALAGCESVSNKKDPIPKSVIDAGNLNDLLLAAGDPEESIQYFETALAQEPDRADFRRGLAISLGRAKRYPEAARVWQEMTALGQDTASDRIEYAFVAARLQRWDDVRAVVGNLPGSLQSSRRFLVTAMLADHDQNWALADDSYGQAERLATNPASVLNNWGVSKMSRKDLTGAEATFERALSFDARLFNAKNNLAISRGLQGNFELPIVPMTEKEKAIILNNLGLIAVRKGEKDIAKGLFAAAVDAHPQHYAAAADRLAALEGSVEN